MANLKHSQIWTKETVQAKTREQILNNNSKKIAHTKLSYGNDAGTAAAAAAAKKKKKESSRSAKTSKAVMKNHKCVCKEMEKNDDVNEEKSDRVRWNSGYTSLVCDDGNGSAVTIVASKDAICSRAAARQRRWHKKDSEKASAGA